MARPHIEFVQALDIMPERVGEGRLAGAARRVLSVDDDSGASSALVSLDRSWSSDLGGAESPLEIFLLTGCCRLGDAELTPGCYAHIPPDSSNARLTVSAVATAIIMVDEPGTSSEAPVLIRDTKEMRWVASAFSSVPPGLVNKRLRDDPQTGDRTWVAACPPGWIEERAEVHPTIEESLTLRGEILLGTRGVMTPGCYFWRPPMVPHGPMYSRIGAEFFFRTKGGTLQVDYETVPEWDRIVEEYRGREPLYDLAPVTHARV